MLLNYPVILTHAVFLFVFWQMISEPHLRDNNRIASFTSDRSYPKYYLLSGGVVEIECLLDSKPYFWTCSDLWYPPTASETTSQFGGYFGLIVCETWFSFAIFFLQQNTLWKMPSGIFKTKSWNWVESNFGNVSVGNESSTGHQIFKLLYLGEYKRRVNMMKYTFGFGYKR